MFSLGVEQAVDVGAKRYTLGRLTLSVLRELKEFVADQVGDPFALVERMKSVLPEKELLKLLEEAKEVRDQLAFFNLDTPLARKAIGTPEGVLVLFRALLRKSHPDATEEEVMGVAEAASSKLGEVLKKAQGGPEGNGKAPGVASPAAGAASAGATCSTA